MATDSRWSVTWGSYLRYVDDVPFEKIELFKTTAFMFAGRGTRIQEWKNWIRSGPTSAAGQPACEGISICVIDMPTATVQFHQGQDIQRDQASFAGTGSRFAYQCWEKNRDPLRCVQTAMLLDPQTGGVVKYVEIGSGANNLAPAVPRNEVTINMVNEAVYNRGIIMDLTTKTRVDRPPFGLAATHAGASGAKAQDEMLAEFDQKIASGELSAEAPCDGMYSEWSDDQKRGLSQALANVFDWK